MKTFPVSLSNEKAASATSSCFAVKIGTSIRYSDWDVAFTLSGAVYSPGVPLKIPKFTASGGKVSIGNVDDAFTALIINGTIKGESISVYEVFVPGDTPVAEMLYAGTIDGQAFNASWATLTVSPARVQAMAQCPRRRMVPACGFVFKSVSCGYSGASARCAKNIDTCLNPTRFAGFRFIPSPGRTFAWGDTIYKVE